MKQDLWNENTNRDLSSNFHFVKMLFISDAYNLLFEASQRDRNDFLWLRKDVEADFATLKYSKTWVSSYDSTVLIA